MKSAYRLFATQGGGTDATDYDSGQITSPFRPPEDSRSREGGTVSSDALRPVPVCNC